MTLDKLKELTCKFFCLDPVEFINTPRGRDEISMARHCFRTLAHVEYGFTQQKIADYTRWNTSGTVHAKKLILENGQFKKEYAGLKSYVFRNTSNGQDVASGNDGIFRITNEAFDSRFYQHPERINPRTHLPYFPAFHTILSLGAPEPIGLSKWRQTMGHFADVVMERSQEIGSYVHDCIDRMIKTDSIIEHSEIHEAFPNAKEAQRVKDCLLGFLTFMEAEEPVIISSEKMMCGQDFGFTSDAEMRLKSDGYKHTWTVDWKTSKVVNEDHKMQVETMRRVSQSDKGMVVVLGNATKKKYTATAIKDSERDYLWMRFQAIKETAYVEILKRGMIKPREDNMPSEFSLKTIKIKRKL